MKNGNDLRKKFQIGKKSKLPLFIFCDWYGPKARYVNGRFRYLVLGLSAKSVHLKMTWTCVLCEEIPVNFEPCAAS